MGNDMTWEQKCRISALRAACASPYDHPTGISDESTNDFVTKRILTRAEAFRVALLSDGALDYTSDEDQVSQDESTPSQLNEQVYIGTCKHCLTAIQLLDPFNDETARWIDRHGHSQCGKFGSTQVHEPELEPPIGAEPLCPECGASKTRPIPLKLEDKSTCRNEWHNDWCNCQAVPVCPGCGSWRKDTPLMISDGMGGFPQCNDGWHQG